ncbi:hypothetical protein C7212DRAFT_361798 [Tuber magnatum]|uniref:Uncharacterized protein n=1 Tax=Tuber magnatum TaxID=42249 RepID=A0A317T0J3_9PEZI|nr:hypothetical protein C7212DRAFT_361798 [Tuber magnatum]
MSCLDALFSCLRFRKRDGARDPSGVKTFTSSPTSPTHTSNASPFSTAGESNSHLSPLPQLPPRAYTVEKGIVYPPNPTVSAASVDYFPEETYAILLKKQEKSLAAGAALYSENYTASWPELNAGIRDMSESGEGWDISNDDICPKPLPRIHTGAMSPMRTPSPFLKAPVATGELEPGSSFLSLLEEYDPSPVKYMSSFGKSGTYREATLSLSPERMGVTREKQKGITETMGSTNFHTLYTRKASPDPLGRGTIEDEVKPHKKPDSTKWVANHHSSEAAVGPGITGDLYGEKELGGPSCNTISISLSGEENSGPRLTPPHAVPSCGASPSESSTNIDSSINFSHLRALVAPSESNLTSCESPLSYGLNSSTLCKENFYTPSEIGVLEESANLLSSVQDYEPPSPIDGSSIYSSEYTSAPILAGMGGSPANVPCLTCSPPVPDGKAPNQTHISHQAPDAGLRKNLSSGPIFYPPAGRTRLLDIGTTTNTYPDWFPGLLQGSRLVTNHKISEKHLGSTVKASEDSKNTQPQPGRSSYRSATTGMGSGRPIISDASHEDYSNQSDAGSLQTASYSLNPQCVPEIEGPQAAYSSRGDSKSVLATPTSRLTTARRLRSSISLADRLRGHGRRNGDIGSRRRASTNSLGNHTTPSAENLDENRDTKSGALGRRLNMSQSLSRLKNKMHPMSGLKYEMDTNIPVSIAFYHRSSQKPGGASKEKDERELTFESDSGNEVGEEIKCSRGADKASAETFKKRIENGTTELASDGVGDNYSITEANSKANLTGYEDCVMLPFSLTSFETLGETESQEKLVEPLTSPECANPHEGNQFRGSQNV